MTSAVSRSLFRRWWWLILNFVVVAAALAALWINQSSEQYESDASYLIRVQASDVSDVVRATATLAGGDEIVLTYVEIATSDLIGDRATEHLGLTPDEADSVEVTGSLVPGTNVLLIGAVSSDPQLAFDMAVTVGAMTEAYVNDLNGVFGLSPLDPANLPGQTTVQVVVIIVGASLIGLALGYGAAAVADRTIRVDPSKSRLRDVYDAQVPAYSRRYMELRMDEERARVRETEQLFSVGTLQLLRRRRRGDEEDEPASITAADLDMVAALVGSTLRPQDMMGHLGRGRFAVILPNMQLDQSRSLVQEWRKSATESLLRDDVDRDIVVAVGACEYDSALFVGDPDAELMASEL